MTKATMRAIRQEAHELGESRHVAGKLVLTMT
jgi:hypothetical protein